MSKFILKPETLASFRQLVDYEVSLCSIFQFGESAGLSQEQMQDLVNNNVLDQNGQIASNALVAIKTLATSDRFSRIRFVGYNNAFEFINYYSSLTQTDTSVTNRDEGFVVEEPTAVLDVINGISNYMGDSVLKSFEFEETLDEIAAFVLLGMIDLNRRNRLNDLVQGSENQLAGININTIVQWLQNIPNDVQWFSSILKEMMQNKNNIDMNQAQGAIDQLIAKGIITISNNGYELVNASVGFANQFLITENLITLSLGQEQNGEVFNSGFTVIQAGVNDLLYIDSRSGEVQLEVISSGRLIEYLKRLVLNISDISIVQEKPKTKIDFTKKPKVQKQETDNFILCSKCNAQIKDGQKFCHECGTPVESKPQQLRCPSCSNVVNDQMIFCTSCGFKLK